MTRILRFELMVALKDRSKTFQLITLVLLSLAVTIIVMGTMVHFTVTSKHPDGFKENAGYTRFMAVPASHLLQGKK